MSRVYTSKGVEVSEAFMSVIADISVPFEEIELGKSLSKLEDIKIEFQRFIPLQENADIYFWVIGNERIIDVKTDEESVVEDIVRLDKFNKTSFYKMTWETKSCKFFRCVEEMYGSVLEMRGDCDSWEFLIRFDNKSTLSDFYDTCLNQDLQISIEETQTMLPNDTHSSGMTETQFETLVLAYSKGYFNIPREITLVELADELGVSDQALSNRMRRGLRTLITSSLINQEKPRNRTER